jgi:uncharacterized protein (TIGR03437 family)
VTQQPSAFVKAFVFLGLVSSAGAQPSSPGRVNYVENAIANFNIYTLAPDVGQQQWLRDHFAAMIVYPPYFDSRLSWFPNAYAYSDFYGIAKGSWEQNVHPEWILHDQNGNWLYIPWGCGGGTCSLYAADIANPAFRAAWINNVKGFWPYPGLFIDDVNMEFRVSDGSGNPVAPIDSTTGKLMTYDAWRNYMVTYLEEVRAAFPSMKIMENTIWYAGRPAGTTSGTDPQVVRQIATADTISLERGVASDTGLTGGTGFWSVYSFFSYVDQVHAAGKGVNFQESTLDAAGLEYGLASYFLISTGRDSIGDASTTPANWWSGYDVDLGTPLGSRSYTNGIFERDFSGGKVLLGEPGLSPQTVNLGGAYTRLDGTPVTSVTIGGAQGAVLLATAPSSQALNGASLSPGPISPGEIVTFPGSFASTPSSVVFNGVTAPIISNNSKQVNTVVPFGLDLSKPADVQIQAGQASMHLTLPVAAASPGIFTVGATGTGAGAILNQDYSVNSPSNPASIGSMIMIYATGFGVLNPIPTDGQIVQALANTQEPVIATIDGVGADVLYAGAAPGLIAGVVQVNVRVPGGVATDPTASLVLSIGSSTAQKGVTVSVQQQSP